MEYSGLGWELTHLLDNPQVGGGYHPIAQMGKLRHRGPVPPLSDTRKWQPQQGQREREGEREGETETFDYMHSFHVVLNKAARKRSYSETAPSHRGSPHPGPPCGSLSLSFPIWKMG